MKKKLAIITTHPIQYNAPFFKLLAASKIVLPKVFYSWGDSVMASKFDPGFNKTIEWDVPLLDGYEYEFLQNNAKDKGSHHYKGIINPEIISRIMDWKPDAILVYGWKFQSHLQVIRHFKNKIPVWFRGDSTLLDEKNDFKSRLKTSILKWVYSHMDLAFYAGTNNKEYFLKFGLRQHQLKKAVHAVDNERFKNENGRYTAAALRRRTAANIRTGAFVFLYAGKLSKKKGVDTLLQAFTTISNEAVHLLVVGNGPLENQLKQQYGEVPNITFIDFQNQMTMPVIYHLCDVFVLPSIGPGESWGLAVNEAMAAGKPVIVSDKCGCAIDLVHNGKNGFTFRAGDVGDLVLKMNTIKTGKDQLDVLGKNASAIIAGFTFSNFVTAIENAISSIG